MVEFTNLGHIVTGVYLDNGTVLLMGKVVQLLTNLLGLKSAEISFAFIFL